MRTISIGAFLRLPWHERLRDWWKCSVCGSRLGHHNRLYEQNHMLRDRVKALEGAVYIVKDRTAPGSSYDDVKHAHEIVCKALHGGVGGGG